MAFVVIRVIDGERNSFAKGCRSLEEAQGVYDTAHPVDGRTTNVSLWEFSDDFPVGKRHAWKDVEVGRINEDGSCSILHHHRDKFGAVTRTSRTRINLPRLAS